MNIHFQCDSDVKLYYHELNIELHIVLLIDQFFMCKSFPVHWCV